MQSEAEHYYLPVYNVRIGKPIRPIFADLVIFCTRIVAVTYVTVANN